MAGVYIHIPFCKQTCSYCDFHFSTSLKSKEAFVSSLIHEIELQINYLGKDTIIQTIYFGGGTPSILSAAELDKIFKTLYKNFNISNNAEITLEANPDDLSSEKLQQLKQSPVNRLSIGIQSFFEDDLKLMNRAHSAVQAEKCIIKSQDAGFENITIDLIYGTPGLTNTNWKKNLAKVFSYGIPHLSSYSLTVEEKTPLESHIKKGKIKPVDEHQSAEQFLILMEETTKHGFEQYEISNFGKPGFHSQHNSNYWKGIKYLGLGPSAHSFDGNSRQWNVANNFRYIQSISENTIPAEKEILTTEQKFNEYMMIGLRTSTGISLEKVQTAFGEDYLNKLLAEAKNYMDCSKITLKSNHLVLTNSGKLIADRISSDFFV
ncbi:MAG: Oxygen-independent coproporphyrinogen-III oxidase-like protein YqeR [Bacteroidia bacterium]|nr:Oxygen-independent coproporphyrinogen-III oxidase-like protein YqeR [Bacteroidia bacterium]